MADTIVIAYKNEVDDSGTTLVVSTAATGFEAANLQAAQLSEVYRTTTLAPTSIEARFAGPRRLRLLALLGVKATGTRNLLRHSEDTGNAVWTETKWDSTDTTATHAGTAPSPTGFLIFDSPIDRTSGEHYAEQTAMSLPSVAVADPNFRMHVFARDNGNANRLRLEVNDGGSGYARADFNISAGSVTASGDDGTEFADVAGTIEDKSTATTWYKCTLTCRVASTASALIPRIQALSSAGAATYTPSADFQWCNFFAGITDRASDGEATTAANASVARWLYDPATSVGGTATDSLLLPFPLQCELLDRGTIDSYYLLASETVAQSVKAEIYDANNANSQQDAGRFYAGPVWQPAQQTFINIGEDSSGKYRKWTIELGQQIKESERFGELDELRRTLQVVDQRRLRETPSGQLIAEDGAKPVLVILDPDETTNPQEKMIYGWVVGMTSARGAPVNVSGTLTEMFSVTLTIWEALP